MEILSNNSIDRAQWEAFVASHPKGNVFQTPQMFDVYQQTPGYVPQVIALEQDKQMVGLMMWVVMREKGLKARFSARSIIQGAPLAKDDKPEYIIALLEAYEQMRDKGVIYTQVRNHFEMLTVNDAFQQCGYRFTSHLNFIITLDNEEDVWNRIGKGRIKQIKKAQKNGLYVDVYEPGQITDELIAQGYEVIRSVYQRAGLPLTDLEQIKATNKQKLLVVFVVRNAEGEMLGCRFGLLYRDSIYGWYAGSFSQYYSLFPNDILIWETLRWGIRKGYKTFDYGGAGEPNKPYGVRAFKQQMGGALVNFGRYEKIHRPALFKIGVMGIKMMRIAKPLRGGGGGKILVNEEINEALWREFVAEHPLGTVFHTPEMWKVYGVTENVKPLAIAVEVEGHVVGVLLAQIMWNGGTIGKPLTGRSIITGGPLAIDNDEEVLEMLMEAYRERLPKWVVYSEIRPIYPIDELMNERVNELKRWKRVGHYNLVMRVDKSEEELWNGMHKERRRNVGQAEKAGLRFEEVTEAAGRREVVALLRKTYERKHVPMADDSLFARLTEIMPEFVRFFAAYKEDKMIAGQIRLGYKDLLYAWYAGSDEDYFKLRPNDFTMWNVIRWAHEKGYKEFDFGGGGEPGKAYGVRDYKLKYGCEMFDYGRYVWAHRPVTYWAAAKAYALYHRIKGK